MNAALVIPTRNAVKGGKWREVLAAVAAQNFVLNRKIIIDSSSTDATCAIAGAFGWECWTIQKEEFNHGGTRDSAVRKLLQDGIDTVVFLSQDVILASPDSLRKITDFLWNNPVSGCFGMQRTHDKNSLNAWQRDRCYPAESKVRTLADVPEYGMMTVFFSNAFSAWKTADVIHYGGFPKTNFGEDTLLAAKILKQGGAVGYCAEAEAFHDHPNTLGALFGRGMQIGAFHREHPELLQQFRGKTIRPAGKIPVSVWLQFVVKVLGYFCGRMGQGFVPCGLFLLMWFLLIPAVILYDFPQRDVAVRYAPMAEAFARGDWQYALHPRVPPLLPICGGIISYFCLFGGYLSCQLAASLFLTIGIFPLYFGCRKIYGEKKAILSGLLYALCPPFLRLGYYGLRETGVILGMVLLFYSACTLREKRNKLCGFFTFAVAEVLLLLSRGDVALFSLIVYCMLFLWDVQCNHIPWRSVFAGGVIFALLAPQLLYNYHAIGYPVPEIRHAVVLRKMCRKMPFLKCLENPMPSMPLNMKESVNE